MIAIPALILAAVVARPTPAAVLPPANVGQPPASAANPNRHVSAHWELRRADREQCARAAVLAMGEREKFRRAAITPDGNVWGDVGTTTAAVLLSPHPDGTVCLWVTVGPDAAESSRLNVALREHMAANPTPAVAKSSYADGTDRPVGVGGEGSVRPAAPLIRFFPQAAGIALEKHGLSAGPAGNGLAMGCGSGRVAVLYCVPGPVAATCHVGAVVICDDADLARRTAAALSASVSKILFE